jgi:hypothetical protein
VRAQVAALAHDALRRIEKRSFAVADHVLEQLKAMLAMGAYAFAAVPLPARHGALASVDMQVRA